MTPKHSADRTLEEKPSVINCSCSITNNWNLLEIVNTRGTVTTQKKMVPHGPLVPYGPMVPSLPGPKFGLGPIWGSKLLWKNVVLLGDGFRPQVFAKFHGGQMIPLGSRTLLVEAGSTQTLPNQSFWPIPGSGQDPWPRPC